MKNFKELKALQFTLHFNAAVFNLIGIEKNGLAIEYATNKAGEGIVPILWTEATAEDLTIEDGTVIFNLKLQKKNKFCTEDIQISGDITAVEAWDKDHQLHDIIKSKGAVSDKISEPVVNKESFKISPNPSRGLSNLSIQSTTDKTVKVHVINTQGKTVWMMPVQLSKGSHNIRLDFTNTAKLSAGIYYVKIEGINNQNTQKLIISE